MTQLVAVPHASVEAAWLDALPLIVKIADSAPDLTLSALWSILRGGGGELWLAGSCEAGHKAAAIAALKPWGDGTAAFVYGAASDDSGEWHDAIPAFVAGLKARGANVIIFEGRKGWPALVPGARVIRQTYEVKLT